MILILTPRPLKIKIREQYEHKIIEPTAAYGEAMPENKALKKLQLKLNKTHILVERLVLVAWIKRAYKRIGATIFT